MDGPVIWEENELELLDDNPFTNTIGLHNQEMKEIFDQSKEFIQWKIIKSDYESFFINLEDSGLYEKTNEIIKYDFYHLKDVSIEFINLKSS